MNAQTRPVVVGLVGGSGCGKSTVARFFEACGAQVIDADRLAHQALEQPEVVEAIRTHWGEEYMNASGKPDRARIAERVFDDAGRLSELTRMVHPPTLRMIREELKDALAANVAPVIVIDAPLLIEAGLDSWCDRIIFVAADPVRRIQRVRGERNWAEEELARREAHQQPADEKRCRANYIIDNNGSTEETHEQVRRLFQELISSRTDY